MERINGMERAADWNGLLRQAGVEIEALDCRDPTAKPSIPDWAIWICFKLIITSKYLNTFLGPEALHGLSPFKDN